MMRNPNAKHIDFSDLEGVVDENPKLLPSDVDFVLERKGRFLYGEFKRTEEIPAGGTPEQGLSGGQRILLEQLAKKPGFNVFVCEGWNEGTSLVVKRYARFVDGAWETRDCDLDGFKRRINAWYDAAEGA